ncbi:MAG: ABC transporter substrate-binding protein [Rhodoluna sp.]|nr:ABC transporter substrate-binding protein [Rhodoluna sp.]
MKRFFVAIVALSTLALTGCSTTLHLEPGSIVNVAETATMISLNPDVVTTASAEKLADEVANLTTESFYSLNEAGALVANPGFGTVTVDSENPLTVTYEITKGRKWSDGQPIDSADLVLSFAAATNPEQTNFYSRRAGNGLKYASVKEVGLRSLTLQFSQPVSDWRTALPVAVAAHAVAFQALDGISASAGKASVIEAVQGKDATKLAKLADSYRTAFSTGGDKFALAALVSNGAYEITNVIKDVSVALEAVTKYKGDFAPVAEKVNVKVYGDSMAALAEMNANKIDIIGATESGLVKYPDLIGMVSSLSTTKAATTLRNGSTADMVVFNFGNGSAFNAATYKSKPGVAAELRKAFMSIIPKARIVASASGSTPVSASDSFVYPSNSDYYRATSSANGSENYLLQDIEQASEIVKASGVSTPVDVRVVYDSSNPHSVAEYKAIAVRAASAGFNLIDSSSASPTRDLLAGLFDVYIGPRELVGVPGSDPSRLVSDPITGYTDSQVSALLLDYAKASKEIKQASILQKIDARLYATGYGIPLYEVPNLIIYRSKFNKISVSPFGDSATWGYWTWSVSSK